MTHQYGIDPKTLDRLITTPAVKNTDWGAYWLIVSLPEYKLERLDIAAGKNVDFAGARGFEATVFVEQGTAKIGELELSTQEVVALPPDTPTKIQAIATSTIYVFSGLAAETPVYYQKSRPFDFREKYWGNIQTIVSGNYAAKRMLVRKGQFASLEYHCRKLESYFIHSGKLLLRLRAGRAEDQYFEMPEGKANITPPGLMHQRGGFEDSVIMEISTRDEDSDSFLVEDGLRQPMTRLQYLLLPPKIAAARKICFDIDGVLRTQTEGDYENAKPVWEAINLVNKLYDEGHRITLYTSSFMGRSKSDPHAAYNAGYEFNKKQLALWGVKYHQLFMGKPPTDVLIDDRAVGYKADWQLIEKEIRVKIAGTLAATLPANIEQLKELVCQQNLRLADAGLVILTEGNVSQITSDRQFVIIKPSGVEYRDLTPEKMVVVDMAGNVVSGNLRPSVDTLTHLEIYRQFPKVGGITHTHSSFATTFAQMQKPIPCYGTTHADAFFGDVPVTRSLTAQEITEHLEINTGKVIAEVLQGGNHRCVLVASHGPFVFGKDARDSVNYAAIVEQVAMMAILGQYQAPIQEALLKKHYTRKHGDDHYYGQV